jgi:peptide deformylase
MEKFLPIIINPNPILRKLSIPVNLDDLKKADIKQLLLDMAFTMKKKDGAGLAAPQIGQNIRIVVINDESSDRPIIMVNPQITKKSWGREIDEEGCLSVLDNNGEIIYGPVERYKKVTCNYYDETGTKRKIQAEKLLARAIQHEIDHLDGILFIDRVVK